MVAHVMVGLHSAPRCDLVIVAAASASCTILDTAGIDQHLGCSLSRRSIVAGRLDTVRRVSVVRTGDLAARARRLVRMDQRVLLNRCRILRAPDMDVEQVEEGTAACHLAISINGLAALLRVVTGSKRRSAGGDGVRIIAVQGERVVLFASSTGADLQTTVVVSVAMVVRVAVITAAALLDNRLDVAAGIEEVVRVTLELDREVLSVDSNARGAGGVQGVEGVRASLGGVELEAGAACSRCSHRLASLDHRAAISGDQR